MSDPIFLRNMISNSVYAEAVHSAQIQGQQEARERATRLRQEKIQDEQAAILRMAEAGQTGLEEREGKRREANEHEQDTVDDRQDAEAFLPEQQERKEGGDLVRHIDLTI